MGGRGAGSRLTNQTAAGQSNTAGGTVKNLDDAQTAQDVSLWLASKGYTFGVSPTIDKNIPVRVLKSGAKMVMRLYNELGLDPSSTFLVRDLDSDEHRPNAIMSASFYGDINYNPLFYGSEDLANQRDEKVAKAKSGWNPGEGKDHTSDIAHELGHSIEAYLIAKRYTNGAVGAKRLTADAVNAWTKHTISTEIIREAATALKKSGYKVTKWPWSYTSPDGKVTGWDNKKLSPKGTSVADYVGSVSGYARTNRSECLAECVCDYLMNGSSASRMSQEVWRIVKREMKK